MPRESARAAIAALSRSYPLCIAHRGASGHRLENTLEAFALAAHLNADMWEIDVQLSSDGVCVVSHDSNLLKQAGVDMEISQLTFDELRKYKLHNGEMVPSVLEVIELAQRTGCGLYVELKARGTGPKVVALLESLQIKRAVIGSFGVEQVAELARLNCPYPLSVLVPVGADPFALAQAAGADMIHLCWERASDTPHQLLTKELMAAAAISRLPIVAWHEEREEVIAALVQLPIFGICTDLPEMINRYRPSDANPIEIVCHRGAHTVAPENTLAAAALAYRMGAQYVELDVRTSSDGKLVVIHDATLERTTNLGGQVAECSAEVLSHCDAGSWFHARYRNEGLRSLADFLALATHHDRSLYIELKSAPMHQVMQELAACSAWSRCFLWCEDQTVVDQIQAGYPQARTMRRRQDFRSLDALLEATRPYVIEYDFRIDDLSEIPRARVTGARVMLRFFSKDPDDVMALIALKPDMVNVDDPFLFSRAYKAERFTADKRIDSLNTGPIGA